MLKRLLAFLLALCMLFAVAQAELVIDTEEDDDENTGFTFDDAEYLDEVDAMSEQYTIDTTIDVSQLEINPNLPDNVINILLIGVDTRGNDLASTGARADVQIVLSINTEDGSVKLTSIMRDLYITLPGNHGKGRINTSYLKGGPQLAMRTINNMLELNIQYYVVINFHGLAEIIDSIGGVDLELTKSEARAINEYLNKYRNRIKYDTAAKEDRVPLEKVSGVQHLDGLQAVMYARLRENLGGDFQRTARQRYLLDTLLQSILTDMNPEVLLNLAGTSMQYVQTNMSLSEIVSLATRMLPALTSKKATSDSLLGQMRVPMGEDKASTWKYYTTDAKEQVIVFRSNARKQENVKAVHEFIYGEYIPAN